MSSPEGDELFPSLRMHYHIRHKGWYTNGFGHPLGNFEGVSFKDKQR